ncbi:MAG: thioredoxin domain-containing protein [Aggregatilineales bacterium]
MKRIIAIGMMLVVLLSIGIYTGLTNESITFLQIDPTEKWLTVEARMTGAYGEPTLSVVNAMLTQTAVALGVDDDGDEDTDDNDDETELVAERLEDGGFIAGDPDAPITIVFFGDALCPHCQAYHPTLEQIIEELVLTGMARLEFRYLPTRNESLFVATVLECADILSEGTFFTAYSETIAIASTSGLDETYTGDIATLVEVDEIELLQCTLEADQVDVDRQLAADLEITGTPAIRIRYGDSDPESISDEHSRGGVPFEVIAEVVEAAQVELELLPSDTPTP